MITIKNKSKHNHRKISTKFMKIWVRFDYSYILDTDHPASLWAHETNGFLLFLLISRHMYNSKFLKIINKTNKWNVELSIKRIVYAKQLYHFKNWTKKYLIISMKRDHFHTQYFTYRL